jgi:hypothetical protein
MSGLLKSRKFWIAVFGVVQALVLHYFDVPETVWQSIAALAGALIASIAIEDAGEKAGRLVITPSRDEDDHTPIS